MVGWQEESLTLGLRLIVGATFVRAGLSKVSSRESFTLAVLNYRIVGPRPSRVVARWLPSLEIALGILLVLGPMQAEVAVALAGLLLVFSAAVVANLVRGRAIDCGCFGPAARKRITWWTVLRNVALAVAALGLAILPNSALALGHGGLALSVVEAFAIAVAGMSLLLVERVGMEAVAAQKMGGRLQEALNRAQVSS